MKKISRDTVYKRMRPMLETADKDLIRRQHPELDLSRFDLAGGFNVDTVRDLPDEEFEKVARGLGALNLDEQLER